MSDTPESPVADDSPLNSIGKITPRPIVSEMEESYLSYAMSVIVMRALPDVRDGLKPVHRRILFSMHELGLRSSARFRKSALVVGDVLGKYHPHGDSSVYEALVRMAQDFSMRYPLINGQGNFGSIDGDRAAAMRYTEAKMRQISDEILYDIEKDTVDFVPNYDGSRKEPSVLPAQIPNLLLNGTVGIAVGMATNIPPHNLGELIDALLYLADNSEATVDDLLEFVKGPDFPTAGFVYDQEVLKQAYSTGRGSVVMRGKAEIEETKNGRHIIHISELPYQVNKANLIEKVAKLVTDKVIQGISDIRDESDRDGIRVIVELKKDGYPQKILNQLYKHTDLQSSFGYNCIALVDGIQPRLLNLQELLQFFIDHRRVVITRRVTFDRDRAKERVHILEGLKIAINNIDEVIVTIKKSADTDEARENLMKKFTLSEIQANAILSMQLRRLAALERKKIEDELKEILAFIKECEAILSDPKKVDQIMKDKLSAIKKKYGDERRTQVVPHAVGQFSAKDTIPNEPMIVALTEQGYVKRMSPVQFRAQHRGGKGVKGMTTKEEDEILCLLHGSNHDDLLFFTTTGRVFTLPIYALPKASRTAKGTAIVNLLQLQPEERVAAILKSQLKGSTHLFMVTRKGTVKRTEFSQFQNIRKSGLIAQKVPKGDELRWVLDTSGKNEIFIVSKKGKSIHFKEKDVRSMGRAAAGVRGIKLGSGDEVVVAATVTDPETSQLLVVMENGLGKASPVNLYRMQSRGGSGVKAAKLTTKTGNIIGGTVINPGMDGDLLCLSKKGQAIRMKLSDIPSRGRATQGVIIMRLKSGDKVASMSIMLHDESEEDIVEGSKLVGKKEEKEEREEKGEKGEVEQAEMDLGLEKPKEKKPARTERVRSGGQPIEKKAEKKKGRAEKVENKKLVAKKRVAAKSAKKPVAKKATAKKKVPTKKSVKKVVKKAVKKTVKKAAKKLVKKKKKI